MAFASCPDLRAALLVVATLLASAYVINDDLTILAVTIAFCARHGLTRCFRHCEIGILVEPGSRRCRRAARPVSPAYRFDC